MIPDDHHINMGNHRIREIGRGSHMMEIIRTLTAEHRGSPNDGIIRGRFHREVFDRSRSPNSFLGVSPTSFYRYIYIYT
jgi:hypothetical protein